MEVNCRLCRKRVLHFSEYIFSFRDGMEISEIIMKICPIPQIHRNDGLPQQICEECFEILTSAHQLQKTSVDSDNFFRSQFVSEDIVVKKEKSEDDLPVKIEKTEEEFSLDAINFPQFQSDDDNDEDYFGNETQSRTSATWMHQKPEKTKFNPRPLPGSSKTAPQDRFFGCNFCDAKLKPRNNIIRHLMLKHDPLLKPFGCSYCIQRFDIQEKKESHESKFHVNEKPTMVFCEICGVSGDNEKGMEQHKADDHRQPKESNKRKRKNSGNFIDINEDSIAQDASDDSISSHLNLPRRRDDRFHPRPIPGYESLKYEEIWYQCNFCDKQLKPRKSMLRHIKQKHDPVLLPHGCRKCIERFKSYDDLSEHDRNRHDGMKDEEVTIFCEICGISGNSYEGIANHKADDHNVMSSFGIFKVDTEMKTDVVKKPPDHLSRRRDDRFHPRPLPGHESLKYEDARYCCNFCDKQLRPRKSMLRHMRLKHDPETFPHGCRFCIERFDDAEDLLTHEEDEHERGTPSMLFCDICNVSGDNKEGMENHMLDDHLKPNLPDDSTEKNFKCRRCNETFEHKGALEHHKSTHHQGTTAQCAKCTEAFRDRISLRNHTLMVHDKAFRILEESEITHEIACCACNERFESEYALLKHVNVHRKGYKSVKCDHCPKPLLTFEILYKHVKHHAKPKTHQCLKCNKKFAFDAKFILHLTSHKRKYHRQHACEKCGSSFRNLRDLETHDKVKHHKQTLFICPFCAKSMGSETILTNHIKYVHNAEQEKKYQCKVCSMKFTHTSKLVRHEATHSTQRPHVCEICGAGFKHKEGLTIHIKRHNGTLLKKFECNQCTIKFTTVHRLNQHALTHTGAKPHECTYCDRAYASKGDLVKHLQKVHVGHAVYRCEKCPLAFPRIVELREHLQVHVEEN